MPCPAGGKRPRTRGRQAAALPPTRPRAVRSMASSHNAPKPNRHECRRLQHEHGPRLTEGHVGDQHPVQNVRCECREGKRHHRPVEGWNGPGQCSSGLTIATRKPRRARIKPIGPINAEAEHRLYGHRCGAGASPASRAGDEGRRRSRRTGHRREQRKHGNRGDVFPFRKIACRQHGQHNGQHGSVAGERWRGGRVPPRRDADRKAALASAPREPGQASPFPARPPANGPQDRRHVEQDRSRRVDLDDVDVRACRRRPIAHPASAARTRPC